MKCKYEQLEKAMNHFRYKLPNNGKDTEVEVVIREESFEKGTIMSSVTLTVIYEKESASYEKAGTKIVTSSIEVFPESENRNPIVVNQERFELMEG